MMKAFLYISILFGTLIAAAGCNIINPKEQVPTYVHIDSFTFIGNPAYGSSSHKITNIRAYFNNGSVGNFDLPVTFPVLASSPGTVLVLPGIDFDGLTDYPSVYPFYLGDTLALTPAPGTVINFKAKTSYSTSTITPLPFNANFDDSNPFKFVSGDDSLVRDITPADVFEGRGVGHIKLRAPQDSSTNVSSVSFPLPYTKDSYLELNYKSNMPVQIFITTMVNGVYVEDEIIGLNAPDFTWRKVYLGIAYFAAGNEGTAYNIIIRAQLNDNIGQTSGDAYFDNIKVVSF